MSSSNESNNTNKMPEEITDSEVDNRPSLASIRSRILAMVYDGLIILFISTVVIFIIQVALIGDKTIPADHILNKILKPMWFVPGFFYLAYHWRKTGQTPSMKVWKIKLIDKQGNKASWFQALLRYVSAILGLGIFWALFNKNKASLQDVISQTSIVQTKS